MKRFAQLIVQGFSCRCPACKKGNLYPSLFVFDLNKNCTHCGLSFEKSDSADGPAVFLIFILGFALVPMALLVDYIVSPPLWFHALFWGTIALTLCLGSLKPLKSLVILLQYTYRKTDWDRP